MHWFRMGDDTPISCTTIYQKWTDQPIHLAGSKNPMALAVGVSKHIEHEYKEKKNMENYEPKVRYYTAVGINLSYKDGTTTPRIMTLDKGQNTHEYEIDKFQLAAWLFAHGHILSEDELYKKMSGIWFKVNDVNKPPVFRIVKSLVEMGLLICAEGTDELQARFKAVVKTFNIPICMETKHLFTNDIKSLFLVIKNSITRAFLPKEERLILREITRTYRTTLLSYAHNLMIERNISDLEAEEIVATATKNLMEKNYIFACGTELAIFI